MPIFEYKATDSEGRPFTGTLISTSLVAAAEDLGKRGLTVQNISLAASANDPIPAEFTSAPPQAAPPIQAVRPPSVPQASRSEGMMERPRTVESPPIPTESPNRFEGAPPTAARSVIMTDVVGPLIRFPLDQLLFFFRQLGTMINAGVPMYSSLETLSRQTRDARLTGIIKELMGHVQAGRELSVGMQRYPEVFSPLMLSMMRAGEQGGMLDIAMNQMADYIEREIQLRNLIRKATLYPKIVIFASIAIILAANYIIREVFAKPGGIYSPLTQGSTWLVLGPLLVLLFLFFRIGVTNPRAKHNYDYVLLRIPGIGGTVHQMAMAKFARAFAALYKAGVPVGKSIELSADACGNDYLRSQMYPASRWLEEGMSVSEALMRTGVFSTTVLDMAQTGDATGRLDEMLEKVADYYEDDSAVRANQLAIVLGVLCFLAVAAYVAYIVISFYSGQMSTMTQAGDGG